MGKHLCISGVNKNFVNSADSIGYIEQELTRISLVSPKEEQDTDSHDKTDDVH